jgi:hypothetical protein
MIIKQRLEKRGERFLVYNCMPYWFVGSRPEDGQQKYCADWG